jgi:uncharacterized alkaline shock family protein YloU
VPSQTTRRSAPGRSLVSRRALLDIVRTATLGSYGVMGFAGAAWMNGLAGLLGLPARGIKIALGEELAIELDLAVAHGVPIAEVARQVDSAVRYAVRRTLGREIDRLTIHVNGLRAGTLPADRPIQSREKRSPGIRQDDLAASGTDVA